MQKRKRLTVGLVDEPAHMAAVETFARISGSGMKPANIHRLLANSPQIFSKFIGLAHALRFESEIDPRDRELAILRVLEKSGGAYELSHHRPMGLRCGLSQAQIDAVSHPQIEDSGLFDERQKTILGFADAFVAGEELSAGLAASIAKHFDDRLVVEFGLTMALYLGLAHLTAVIDLPLDQR